MIEIDGLSYVSSQSIAKGRAMHRWELLCDNFYRTFRKYDIDLSYKGLLRVHEHLNEAELYLEDIDLTNCKNVEDVINEIERSMCNG